MGRKFNGTTDSAVSSSVSFSSLVNGASLAFSFWLWWDAFASGDQLALGTTRAGGWVCDPDYSGAAAFSFGMADGGGGTSFLDRFARPSAAAWHHYLLASTRPRAATGQPARNFAYVDGVAQGLTSISAGAMSETWADSVVHVMSQIPPNVGNAAGRISDLAIWQTNFQFAGLGTKYAQTLFAGASPLYVLPDLLLAYWPFDGESPEPDDGCRSLVGGGHPVTLTGTTFVQPRPVQSVLGMPLG